jgi:hypothetical protein
VIRVIKAARFHGHDSENRHPWLPKMDFPRFDGSKVHVWLDKCLAYFHLYSIPHEFHVTAASLHMVDRASHWFQNYKNSAQAYSWVNFMAAVSQKFEINTHRVKTMELLNLSQTGQVEEYKLQFD